MDENKASQDLPILDRFADEVVKLAEEVLDAVRCNAASDDFGFMACCFLAEQVSYLRAIRELTSRGLGRPAGLIARTMLEGLALLHWAKADPKRSLRWREYVVVADYRTMLRRKETAKEVDPKQEAKVRAAAQQFGSQLLTPKAKKAQAACQPLPQDPYVRSWHHPYSAADIFGQVEGATALYDHIYRAESEKAHWSIAALGQNLRHTPGGMVYAGDSSAQDSARVLAVGFQSLIETLTHVDGHFELRRSKDISSLRGRYVASLPSAR